MSAADPTIPYRIVGSFEYDQAVKRLQRLAEISTPEEIEAYDRLLEEHPEYSYYAGLNVGQGLAPGTKIADPAAIAAFDRDYKRTGLAWMLALAKIELGATIACYTEVDRPFGVFAPTPFDQAAFLQVLLDDCAAHVSSLDRDAAFKEVMRLRGRADAQTVAYLRRLKLIRDMLDVLASTGNPEVLARIRPARKKLNECTAALVMHVKKTTEPVVTTNTTTANIKGRIAVAEDTSCQSLVNSLDKE